MEFFEKAHVAKSKDSSRKETKSEDNMKRQLKQMLYGYKNNDNELIKSSVNVKNDEEDSSSVSGFSDLNITNSSFEGDASEETIRSAVDDASTNGSNDSSISKSLDSCDSKDDSPSVSIESISEFTDDIQSLSEEALENDDCSSTEQSEDNTSTTSLMESSLYESQASESFDADGSLAAKIFEKLSESSKKRKLETPSKKSNKAYKGPSALKPDEYSTTDEEEMGERTVDRTYKGPYRPTDVDISDNSKDVDSVTTDNDTQDSHVESVASAPYISIEANNMRSQRFSEILGEYRFPTARNQPYSQDGVSDTRMSSMFKVQNDDLSTADIQVEEDVGSLVPEIDDDLTVDDIGLDNGMDNTDLDISMPSEILDSSARPEEDSTVYDNTLQSKTSDREPSTESIDRNLIDRVKVYYGKNNCVIVLSHPAQLFIHGKVKVKCLGGTVEILGYTLQNESCDVYAPNHNYAHCLKTVENTNIYYGLFGKLSASGLSVSEAEDIVTALGEHDSVVKLQALKSSKMDFVESSCTATDLFSKTTKYVDNSLKKVTELVGCSLYLTKPWKCLMENESWQLAVKCGLDKQSRGIVCGGKGAGKSTFLRYYVNRLLARGPVVVLDLDPGQCEFTPAGNVSATVVTTPLLGPNYTHLATPDIMLNIGLINTMDNPKRYAAAVQALIAHCSSSERLRNMPWIINTMGMCNSMGLKLISLIILQSQPTFLLQIDSNNAKKRFEYHLYPQTIKNLYFEDYLTNGFFRSVEHVEDLDYTFLMSRDGTAGNRNFSLAPRDERYLNFLAYFGDLATAQSGLLAVTPYEVKLKDLRIGTNVRIDAGAAAKVINGKVVALCQHDADGSKVFTLGNIPLLCHGHGLIRGIDWVKGVLFIITPVCADRLAAVNTLVYADWVPEVRGQEKHLPPGTPAPYRTASHYHQRQLMFTPKRRFNPIQLLKISRNT